MASPLDAIPRRLGQGLLAASPTLIYTVPATITEGTVQSAVIRTIVGANVTGVAHRITVWLVPTTGGPKDDTTALFKDLLIPPEGVVNEDSVHVLMPGGEVWGSGDTVSVFNLTVDGAHSVTP